MLRIVCVISIKLIGDINLTTIKVTNIILLQKLIE